MKRLFPKSPGRFARAIASSETSFAFLVSLIGLAAAYRLFLYLGLFTNPIRPFDFTPGPRLPFLFSYWIYDLGMVLAGFLLCWLLSQAGRFLGKGFILLLFRILAFFPLQFALFALTCFHLGHLRVLFDVQTGLDYSIMQETFSSVSSRDILKFLEMRDYLFLLFPFVLFWLVLLLPLRVKTWMVGISLAGIGVVSVASVLLGSSANRNTPAEIRLNPVLFLAADTLRNTILKPPDDERKLSEVPRGDAGLRLGFPEYSQPFRVVKTVPVKPGRRWNIVFLVLESVGTRYMFDAGDGNSVPMPFLKELAGKGWHWERHYTTSNVSTKAVFSLFSGLYDLFRRDALGTRPDAGVPSLYNFLPRDYDSFFVSPSSSTWYFPVQFMKNSGLPEMHTYENLKFQVREELHSLGRYIARDEIQTVDFFLRRLDKAREPFFGIYISFAAHFPYFDYGPNYRVREDDGRLISRYYNNLNLLDQMVRRIFEHLQRKGQLDRTVLVIAGDHGQAFGQHQPDNYLHYRYTYNENLETPLILYQPSLFPARKIEVPTSHVDLLPTLLDALRIPYDPVLLDGESLFQKKLPRRYLFFYGLEETLSSLDDQGIKIQHSRKKNTWWAFDLKADPGEKYPLDVSSYPSQVKALRRFVNYHDSRLLEYNAEVKGGKDFQGHRHPNAEFGMSIRTDHGRNVTPTLPLPPRGGG